MEIEQTLIKGNIYTIEELKLFNCKFVKQTSAVIFFKKEEKVYAFDQPFYALNSQYKLLSVVD